MTDAVILAQAAAWLEQGLGVALATVVRTWGSAPRPSGSQLVVNERGDFAGSVSGGCVEAAVVEAAQGCLRTGAPRRLAFGVTDEQAWAVGLACGGTVEVAVARLPGLAALAPLLDDLAARRPAVLALDLAAGTATLLHPDEPPAGAGPAGRADPLADPLAEAARAAALRGRSGPLEWPGPATFLRVYAPPVRVVVVGAVHVAQALVPMAQLAGFHALVVDPRPAFAAAARFPGAEVLTAWPEAALARLALDRHTALVALSHQPRIDDPALAAALVAGAFYVGALGSRKTHAARCQRLAAMGLAPGLVARVRGPIGLDLGAEGPGEIAVAILAELVAHLRRPTA